MIQFVLQLLNRPKTEGIGVVLINHFSSLHCLFQVNPVCSIASGEPLEMQYLIKGHFE